MQVVECSDVVVVATKPPLVPKVLTEVNPVVQASRHLIISIAMGIPITNLEQVSSAGQFCDIAAEMAFFDEKSKNAAFYPSKPQRLFGEMKSM